MVQCIYCQSEDCDLIYENEDRNIVTFWCTNCGSLGEGRRWWPHYENNFRVDWWQAPKKVPQEEEEKNK